MAATGRRSPHDPAMEVVASDFVRNLAAAGVAALTDGIGDINLGPVTLPIEDIVTRMTRVVDQTMKMTSRTTTPSSTTQSLAKPAGDDNDDDKKQPAGTLGVHFSISHACQRSCNEMLCCGAWKCCNTTTIMMVDENPQKKGLNLVKRRVGDEYLEDQAGQTENIRSHQELSRYLVGLYGYDLPYIFQATVKILDRDIWRHWDPFHERVSTVQLQPKEVKELLSTLKSAFKILRETREALMREDIEVTLRKKISASEETAPKPSAAKEGVGANRSSGHDSGLGTGGPSIEAQSAAISALAEVIRYENHMAQGQPIPPSIATGLERHLTASTDSVVPTSPTATGRRKSEQGSGSSQSRNIMIEIRAENGDAKEVPFVKERLVTDIRSIVDCADSEIERFVSEFIESLPDRVTKAQIWQMLKRKLQQTSYTLKKGQGDSKVKEALTKLNKSDIDRVKDLSMDDFIHLLRELRPRDPLKEKAEIIKANLSRAVDKITPRRLRSASRDFEGRTGGSSMTHDSLTIAARMSRVVPEEGRVDDSSQNSAMETTV